MSEAWISNLLGGPLPAEGDTIQRQGRKLRNIGGILRDTALVEADQAQTQDMFAFKWAQRDTYSSDAMRTAQLAWLNERYGGQDLLAHLGDIGCRTPLVLDAGCGSGFSANLMLSQHFKTICFVGSDISHACEIAAERIGPLAPQSLLVQADLMHLPFAPASFDIVMAEGVMHHTPSTRDALLALSQLLRPGAIFTFYVYAKKAPIREFTDDYIRSQVADLAPEQAWKAIEPLTRLGIALGELKTKIDVPEDVALLGIPKGRIDIQRLFYWAICKAYYRPEFSFDEMNHVNFDWFTPKYSHRQTPEEVRAWCGEAKLAIEHMKTEQAGITVVARRSAAG